LSEVSSFNIGLACRKHPEVLRADKCYKCRRDQSRKVCLRKYGLTLEDYDRMLREQGGGCAICGGDNKGKPFDVEHCHTTGKVRGLTCRRCNSLVAVFERTDDLLGKVAEYLAKHSGKVSN